MLNVVQLERGVKVVTDSGRDRDLTSFGRAVLDDRYLLPGESYQDLFARVATHFADDSAHAQRLYDAMSKQWFMPATPVLSNGGTKRGLPISCFLNEAADSLDGIVDLWNENVWLAARGGGIGSYWGNLRSIGERVGANGETSGVIPFIRVMDSLSFGEPKTKAFEAMLGALKFDRKALVALSGDGEKSRNARLSGRNSTQATLCRVGKRVVLEGEALILIPTRAQLRALAAAG